MRRLGSAVTRLLGFGVAWAFVLLSTPAAHAVCTTLGDGTAYALADLDAFCADVSGAAPTWTAADDIFIAATDTLALGPGQSFQFAPAAGLTIQGNLNVGALAAQPSVLVDDGGGTWVGLELADGATAAIQGLTIQNAGTGITVRNIPTAVWSDIVVSGSTGDGVLFDGMDGSVVLSRTQSTANAGAGFRFRNMRFAPELVTSDASNNNQGIVLNGVGPGGRLVNTTVNQNVAEGVLLLLGATNFSISGGQVSENGGVAIQALGAAVTAGDALSVQGTTMSLNTDLAIEVTGVTSHKIINVDITDGLAGAVRWDGVRDAEIRFSNVERNAGVAIDAIGVRGARYATPDAAADWIDIGVSNADIWETDGDSGSTNGGAALGLPFPVLVDQFTYTSFIQHADGIVELLDTADTPNALLPVGVGYAPVVYQNAAAPRSYLFAQTADWCSNCDAAFDPGATFRGFGFAYLQAGQQDGSGKTIAEDVFVLTWRTQSVEDVNITQARNDFQVQVYEDGRIRWSVENMGFARAPRGVFNGAVTEEGRVIVASRYERNAASYTFNPINPAVVSAPPTLNGNVIRGNADAGVRLTDGLETRIWDNAIGGNLVGIAHGGNSLKTRLVFNNLDGNGPTPGTAEAENTQATVLPARDNFWGVIASEDIDARILGAIDYVPFRTTPIQPGPPGALTGLTATPGSEEILYTWSASDAPDAAGYELRWGTSSEALDFVVEIDGLVTQYQLGGLTNGTRYFAAVAAVDLAGNVGTYSAAVGALPNPDPPPPGGFFNDVFGCGCNLASRTTPRARGASPVAVLIGLLAALGLWIRREDSHPHSKR